MATGDRIEREIAGINSLTRITKRKFIRPNSVQRKSIKDCFKCFGINISNRAYDAIDKNLLSKIVKRKIKHIDELSLVELKTAKESSCVGWTLTANERKVAKSLGINYKIVIHLIDVDRIKIYNGFEDFEKDIKSCQMSMTGFLHPELASKDSLG